MTMAKLLMVLSTALLSGCYTTPKQACRQWVDSQEIRSSYERCEACVKSVGSKDLHAVRSCTFKRDVESLQ